MQEDRRVVAHDGVGDELPAQEAGDEVAPPTVVVGLDVSAQHREVPVVEPLGPAREFALHLHVASGDVADGAHAEPEFMRGGHRGQAHEGARQPPVAVRPGEGVPRAGEVVRAQPLVSGLLEALGGSAEEREPLVRRRQRRVGEGALVRAQRRQVGVTEHRDAVGAPDQHFVHRRGDRVRRLAGEAIDEFEVESLEPHVAGHRDRLAHDPRRLHTPDGALHVGMQVLHAVAEPPEPECVQPLQLGVRHVPRVTRLTSISSRWRYASTFSARRVTLTGQPQ